MDLTCEQCKVVFEALETFANDPDAVKRFLNSVALICSRLRDDLRNECAIVVPLYAPYVIDALQHGLPTREVVP
eukprot:gnl/Chilomastix_caulleri/5224.p3 GENE.gnl/Chilomastix_caulleri/5224~~gnl/Chilomastix_caulleri/5224.p3  ORF type:complete len:74 (+),score=17.43 gnl/Chilomastix_caulleri/5224:57-278(+)